MQCLYVYYWSNHACDEPICSWVDLISSTWVYDWSRSCRWWAYTLSSWLDFKYWVYDWSESCTWWAYMLTSWLDFKYLSLWLVTVMQVMSLYALELTWFQVLSLWLVTVMQVMSLYALELTWFQLPAFMIGHSYACDEPRCSWLHLISTACVYDWSQLWQVMNL